MQYPLTVPGVGLSGGKFTGGNPVGGIPASLDRAEDMNLVYDELINVVVAAGLTPTEGVTTQLRDAILALINGGDYKQSVKVASTAAINLAAPGANIDGVAMVAGDRFLEKDNATAANRGIYIWNGAAVAATRAPDADTGAELNSGAIIPVEQGTVNADTNWQLTTDGTVTIGTTALVFSQLVTPSSSVQGAFKNLQASATGTNALVNVTIDELVVENSINNAYQTLRGVNLAAISTAAVGANGLDTGAIAINTWYSLWIIWNGATVAGLLSLSATSPIMPGGYTHKARVGWIRTDASGNKYPLAFKQYGRRVRYVVGSGTNVTSLPQMASGVAGTPSTPTWAAVGVSNFVPSTAALINGSLTYGDAGTGVVVIAAPNNSYGSQTSTSNPPPVAIGTASSTPISSNSQFEFILESTNIYWASAASGTTPTMTCVGWEDNI